MNFKKIISLIAAIFAVVLITAAAAGFVTWKSFWILILLIGGFAYYVMPRLPDK